MKPEEELTETVLSSVLSLSLEYCEDINDADLKGIARLQSLQSLNLYQTKITRLNDIARLQSLRVLDLGQTKITDEGLKELPKLGLLEKLCLNTTQITDAAVWDV